MAVRCSLGCLWSGMFSGLLIVGLFTVPFCAAQTSAESQTAVEEASSSASPAVNVVMRAQKEALGAILFNDPSLSNPAGQSCATCHKPSAAFSDPGQVASEGVIKGQFGPRNTPSLTYSRFSPIFGKEESGIDWMGGQFWDGRALDFKEQALGPLLNPFEMNNTVAGLAKTIRASGYWRQLIAIYGEAALKVDQAVAEAAADMLDAFQRSDVFAPFDSKWDYASADIIRLTEQEQLGQQIFDGKGRCIDCHSGVAEGSFQVYTRYKMHSIGVPRNPKLPFYTQSPEVNPDGAKYIDLGAGLNIRISEDERADLRGAFKTPTLRNVELTPPYMHNGVFATLDEVIEFYRDVTKFAPSEVEGMKSRMLSMTIQIDEKEKLALIAFLKTLTDGYPVTPEQKTKLQEIHRLWRQ